MRSTDYFNSLSALTTRTGEYTYYRLEPLEEAGLTRLERLPFSMRVALEGVLRQCNEKEITRADVLNLAAWQPRQANRPTMPFLPGRVLMQDFSGVPVMNDLAAMRAARARLGGDPYSLNPQVPVDIVIDHSVQVDYFGTPDAMQRNTEIEFQRNRERYEFLHWCQKAFDNVRVIPPSTGILHQVNIEYLAQVVLTRTVDGLTLAFPDTLVGTDSHTTMVNGLGVLGWGVGGIEAIASMLSCPIEIVTPDVIGFKLHGQLAEGVTPTDLTLTITQMLRERGVVDQFVEFFGSGLDALSLPERAMIANMSPENGATITFFPVDQHTLDYLRLTGRPAELVERVEAYTRAQHLFRSAGTPDPDYTDVIELDMGTVEPSLAGPRQPQERAPVRQVGALFRQKLPLPKSEGGFGVNVGEIDRKAALQMPGAPVEIGHGAVVIAAITSCTNTSDPFVMVAAGLLARNAAACGLHSQPYVKTSLAPGSRVVTDYLAQAGLLEPLAQLGFHLVGYGCTTCIGNTGPLPEPVVSAIQSANLVVGAVISGNRNFEGRLSPYTQANYLASPPLVVAYALAGRLDIDLTTEPLGTDPRGQPVYLNELWPSRAEVQAVMRACVRPELYATRYASIMDSSPAWNAIHSGDSPLYAWDPASTYLQEPPFFIDLAPEPPPVQDILGARALAVLGDSVTTDHISPAGGIPSSSVAGQYLFTQGVPVSDFNSYGARRGNDQVLRRGAFANIRLKNHLVPGREGSLTLHLPDQSLMSIYAAAVAYQAEGVPLVVLAGKEYGTGSSRDWAAKGPRLLGVRAVMAESFERIHRSNLAGMGVLPLQFKPGESIQSLGLTGTETFSIRRLAANLSPGAELVVNTVTEDGRLLNFTVLLRLDTANEVRYFRSGGIMNAMLYR
jgi:aconitate hydratase